jgi:type IV pilus assembly protein PilA
MNKLMKKMYDMKNRKEDNRGFSLVELIIVIAIMAILVGIVGTQVIPYINKSKESKDYQIINSYGTAATTAYSTYAEKVTANVTVDVYGDKADTGVKGTLANEIITLTGYDALSNLTDKMGSTKGGKIAKIEITFDVTSGKTITTKALDASGKSLFDDVVTQL